MTRQYRVVSLVLRAPTSMKWVELLGPPPPASPVSGPSPRQPQGRSPLTNAKVFRTRRKDGNVLFNNTLNTLYLRLYGVRHKQNNVNISHTRKEGNVLFNNAFDTFYLRLYGVRHKQNNVNISHTRKEGNVLFNDAHNTFYLWLYGVRHKVKDHSDSER